MIYVTSTTNPNRRARPWRRHLLVVGATFVCGLLLACGGAEDEEAAPVEVPLTSFDSEVQLNISVGFFNGRLLFTNQSSLLLERILVVVNQGEGENEYRAQLSGMKPNFMLHYSPTLFSNEAGTKLDPKAIELNSVTVYADTPEGRGRWSGNY